MEHPQDRLIQKLNDVIEIQVLSLFPFCHLLHVNFPQGFKMAARVPDVTCRYNNFKEKKREYFLFVVSLSTAKYIFP